MTCVFCPDNWDNLNIVERGRPAWYSVMCEYAIINPLDPVTPGHVLVIAERHSKDAADAPDLVGGAVTVAADYIDRKGIQANIITSIGPAATQTVMHTHVHIVPREEGDGLPLPWTPQHEAKQAAYEARHRDWSRNHEGPMPEGWKP